MQLRSTVPRGESHTKCLSQTHWAAQNARETAARRSGCAAKSSRLGGGGFAFLKLFSRPNSRPFSSRPNQRLCGEPAQVLQRAATHFRSLSLFRFLRRAAQSLTWAFIFFSPPYVRGLCVVLPPAFTLLELATCFSPSPSSPASPPRATMANRSRREPADAELERALRASLLEFEEAKTPKPLNIYDKPTPKTKRGAPVHTFYQATPGQGHHLH